MGLNLHPNVGVSESNVLNPLQHFERFSKPADPDGRDPNQI